MHLPGLSKTHRQCGDNQLPYHITLDYAQLEPMAKNVSNGFTDIQEMRHSILLYIFTHTTPAIIYLTFTGLEGHMFLPGKGLEGHICHIVVTSQWRHCDVI